MGKKILSLGRWQADVISPHHRQISERKYGDSIGRIDGRVHFDQRREKVGEREDGLVGNWIAAHFDECRFGENKMVIIIVRFLRFAFFIWLKSLFPRTNPPFPIVICFVVYKFQTFFFFSLFYILKCEGFKLVLQGYSCSFVLFNECVGSVAVVFLLIIGYRFEGLCKNVELMPCNK